MQKKHTPQKDDKNGSNTITGKLSSSRNRKLLHRLEISKAIEKHLIVLLYANTSYPLKSATYKKSLHFSARVTMLPATL